MFPNTFFLSSQSGVNKTDTRAFISNLSVELSYCQMYMRFLTFWLGLLLLKKNRSALSCCVSKSSVQSEITANENCYESSHFMGDGGGGCKNANSFCYILFE